VNTLKEKGILNDIIRRAFVTATLLCALVLSSCGNSQEARLRQLVESGDVEAALELCTQIVEENPESIEARVNLAKLHFALGHRDQARRHISLAEEMDPLRLSTVLARKRIFFVPDDFVAPAQLDTDSLYLRPIAASDAELDYPAVMGSIEHIKKTLGSRSWPRPDLTLEEDRQSLALHEEEMKRGEAFVYTVMDPEQTEIIGCVYIFISRWDDHDAEVSMWTTRTAFDDGIDPIVFETVKEWIAAEWPFEKVVYVGREISHEEFFAKLDEQDRKYH
jgi:tetratricopeptide (TPR) repeat protein